jgi:hypothetical protein
LRHGNYSIWSRDEIENCTKQRLKDFKDCFLDGFKCINNVDDDKTPEQHREEHLQSSKKEKVLETVIIEPQQINEDKIYKTAFVYSLIANKSGDMYIGSTIKSLEQRLKNHESNYRCFMNGTSKKYITSYEILKQGDYRIESQHDLINCTKKQLRQSEGESIQLFNCVNKRVECRTPEEYRKAHYEEIKENKANYREDNREELRQKQEDYRDKIAVGAHEVQHKTEGKITCECGCSYLKCNEKRHKNSKIHEFALQYSSLPLEELRKRTDLNCNLQGELINKKRAGQCK